MKKKSAQPCDVIFNGRYLSSKQKSGVVRVADQLTRHIDQDDALADPGYLSVLYPPDGHDPRFRRIRSQRMGPLTWQAWEQIQLPFHARNALLVNLCNIAPVLHRRSITMIHDAQVFISPQSYPPAFAAWYRLALPRVGTTAMRVLTVSEYSKTQLVNYGVCDADRIEVLYNGVDHIVSVKSSDALVRFHQLIPAGYIVAFSSTQAHKNIRILFEAFGRPELSDVKLVLVGHCQAEDYAEAGLLPPANVVYAGKASDENLRGLLENAACLAFPSTTEGFGLPPLEAMAVGCPAVVAPCGALPEVCGEAVVYAEEADASQWARALSAMINSESRRLRYSELGLRQAARYRWSDSATRLLEVIAEHR